MVEMSKEAVVLIDLEKGGSLLDSTVVERFEMCTKR